ncbi:MAG: hypothetical protein JWP87_661 [Labilithrix sp.]|nr:hypothetical protein [Labilithrix sp.]
MGQVPRVIARQLLGYVLAPVWLVAFVFAYVRDERERHEA